ncbi:MAG: hypothetical protein HKN25_10390 [Pyrinomonadaceae bacterium]|nr:hypothetical protein [Pyrinomonadaceae bacterium]
METNALENLSQLIFPALLALPFLVVILIGIGLSVLGYKKNSKASLLAIGGLLIFLILQLWFVIQPLINMSLIKSRGNTYYYFASASAVISTIFGAVALALIVAAVWVGRK